jgi:hypothetical protein
VTDDAVIAVSEIVPDDNGASKSVVAAPDIHSANPYVVVAEMARRHKKEIVGRLAEIKIVVNKIPAEKEPVVRDEKGERRKGRPSAVIVAGAPPHPGRPPCHVGPPHPAEHGMAVPPAVVERRPAPWII